MKTFSSTNKAHALGVMAGRVWRCWRLQEQRLADWIVSKGFNTLTANALVWTAKLIFIGAFFYVFFWLSVLLLFIVVAYLAIRNSDSESDAQPKWQNGLLGYGLYDRDGFRIDPHDPDELH